MADREVSIKSLYMKSTQTITAEQDYNAMMAQIDELMKKGEENLSSSEIKRLRAMAEDAEAWEDKSFFN